MLDGKPRPQSNTRNLTADIESCHIPVLTVGCKMDLAPHRTPQAYDRINVDCRKNIPPGSTTSMALARLFIAFFVKYSYFSDFLTPQLIVQKRRCLIVASVLAIHRCDVFFLRVYQIFWFVVRAFLFHIN